MHAPLSNVNCQEWPILTVADILQMHKEDTPEAPVPLWLKGFSILSIALNIVLFFFYEAQNSDAQAKCDAATEELESEERTGLTLKKRHSEALNTQQSYEQLIERAKHLAELRHTWHTPRQAAEGTQEHFLRQSAQNYAMALMQGRRRARSLLHLFLPSASAEIDGADVNGKGAVVVALLNKHKQYKTLQLRSIAAKDSSVLVILRYEDRSSTQGYLAEALEYAGNSVSRCKVNTHNDMPEIPDDYSVITL